VRNSLKCSVEVIVLWILLILASSDSVGAAEEDTTLADTTADTVLAIDTVLFEPGTSLTQYRPVTNPEDLEKHLYQNPTIALFKSMAVPGWGQLGNRRYFKAVLFAGLDAWFITSAIHYGRQAADFRDRYDAEDPNTDSGRVNRNIYYSLYEDRKDQRNKFTWFAVIVSFVSMFDAYVDAHLSGFPVKRDDDLSIDFHSSRDGRVVASVSLRF
jgi:hypothetical protein